ncbi:hypothetical protein KJ707_00080 [Patescibacteria group bacterium]|nr:hypothetical protein [Patescibacteria group bacterium]MBU1966698.1 hypothetical protein [Patescibacteria group bacterium]MBU2542955.1 hypothetical protein [Patescibacteria group bacterium]
MLSKERKRRGEGCGEGKTILKELERKRRSGEKEIKLKLEQGRAKEQERHKEEGKLLREITKTRRSAKRKLEQELGQKRYSGGTNYKQELEQELERRRNEGEKSKRNRPRIVEELLGFTGLSILIGMRGGSLINADSFDLDELKKACKKVGVRIAGGGPVYTVKYDKGVQWEEAPFAYYPEDAKVVRLVAIGLLGKHVGDDWPGTKLRDSRGIDYSYEAQSKVLDELYRQEQTWGE